MEMKSDLKVAQIGKLFLIHSEISVEFNIVCIDGTFDINCNSLAELKSQDSKSEKF